MGGAAPGAGGVALLAVTTGVIRFASTRRTAWPVTRQVAARLEKDEEARRPRGHRRHLPVHGWPRPSAGGREGPRRRLDGPGPGQARVWRGRASLGGGITEVGFAASPREFLERRLKLRRVGAVADSPPDWARFRDLATDLGTDAGVARLLTAHPQLPQARTLEAAQ